MTSQVQTYLNDKAWARWTALALLAIAMFFGYVFVDILSPLQNEVQETLHWSPSDYGNFFGSETFLNVFIFFLIIAGIILDKMGVRFTAVLSGSVMLVGALINYYALTASFAQSSLAQFFDGILNLPADAWWNFTPFNDAMPASAKLACIGFMIFGCGMEMAGITVSRGIVKWFAGKEMALAMGAEMALARLGVAVVFLASVPIANFKHQLDVSRPVGLGCVLVCIGLISFITYCFMDKKLEKQIGNNEEKDDPFKVSDLKYIFTSKVFWIVSLLCVLYYSAIFPFQNYASQMLQCNLSYGDHVFTAEDAGLLFFVFPIGAAVITPFLGSFLDHKGKGATMLIAGALLMIICHLTFALILPAIKEHHAVAVVVSYASIILLGISFALVPASLWPSVPKLVDAKLLGSAYAVIFWIQNIGLYGFRKGIGSLVQAVNPGIDNPVDYNYTIPMLVFAGCGVAALFFGIWLKAIDARKHYGLELPNIKPSAQALEAESVAAEE